MFKLFSTFFYFCFTLCSYYFSGVNLAVEIPLKEPIVLDEIDMNIKKNILEKHFKKDADLVEKYITNLNEEELFTLDDNLNKYG